MNSLSLGLSFQKGFRQQPTSIYTKKNTKTSVFKLQYISTGDIVIGGVNNVECSFKIKRRMKAGPIAEQSN